MIFAENQYQGAPKISYLLSGLGDFSDQRNISTPDLESSLYGFMERSGHAFISGELYLFGGTVDDKMVNLRNFRILNLFR